MNLLHVEIPETGTLQKAKEVIALSLFESGIYSSGQAAKFLNINRIEFIELANLNGVELLRESEEDLIKSQSIRLTL